MNLQRSTPAKHSCARQKILIQGHGGDNHTQVHTVRPKSNDVIIHQKHKEESQTRLSSERSGHYLAHYHAHWVTTAHVVTGEENWGIDTCRNARNHTRKNMTAKKTNFPDQLIPPVKVFVSELVEKQNKRQITRIERYEERQAMEQERSNRRAFRKQKTTSPCCQVDGISLDADSNAIFLLSKPRHGQSGHKSLFRNFKMFVPPTKEDSIIRFAVSGESHGFRMKLPKGLRVGETVGISIPIQLLDADVLATIASKMSKTKDSTEEIDPPGHHNIASTARADRVPTNLDHLSGHSHSLPDHHTLPQKVTKNEPDNLDEDDEAPNSPREGEEIVSPLDKHGNSIHRYFVKGHWIVHSSTQSGQVVSSGSIMHQV